MFSTSSRTIALLFNDCINNRDVEGLSNLMTEDHIFIDSANNRVEGKNANKANWQHFFDLFPFYKNVFETVISRDSTVIMQGYSLCCDEILNHVKAIWTAKIEGGKLNEWRVYTDTKENRELLGVFPL
ncbi:MAG: nuclear transport factor 2 family protein [Tannerellaceae bacterium]|nr:nuclear transport factor 2 family protein [Tannerellaceae bacterium]